MGTESASAEAPTNMWIARQCMKSSRLPATIKAKREALSRQTLLWPELADTVLESLIAAEEDLNSLRDTYAKRWGGRGI